MVYSYLLAKFNRMPLNKRSEKRFFHIQRYVLIRYQPQSRTALTERKKKAFIRSYRLYKRKAKLEVWRL